MLRLALPLIAWLSLISESQPQKGPSCPSTDRPHVTEKCITGRSFKKMCLLRCEPGYIRRLPSVQVRFCRCRSGTCTWNRDPIFCDSPESQPKIPECPSVETRPPATKKCVNGTQFRKICSFSCEEGYKLTNTSSATIKCSCAAGGTCTWNGNPASCERAEIQPKIPECPSMETRPYVTKNCVNGTQFRKICSFSCEEGYKLTNMSSATIQCSCAAGGACTWNGNPASCERETQPKIPECPSVETRPHVTKNCGNGTQFRKICSFSCEEGYKLTKTSSATIQCSCAAGGACTWNGNSASCERAEIQPKIPECPLVETRPHVTKTCVNGTQFRKTCSFSCEEGYKLTNTSSALIKCSCAAGGACTWNDNSATCERAEIQPKISECPSVETRPNVMKNCFNGTQFRKTCSFSCEEGYKLTNTSSALIKCSCAAGGACTWNGNPASCERENQSKIPECPSVETRPHVTKNCDNGTKFRKTCSFSCEEGYKLTNMSSATIKCSCAAGGACTWNGNPASCERAEIQPKILQCPTVETRPHVTKNCVNGTQFKKICSFSCEEGYKLTNMSSATIKCSCAAGGACTWNGNPASCERAKCPALETRPHVTKKCVNGTQFKKTCSFFCEEGYKLTKTSSATIKCSCAAGGACTWNGNPASCERAKCPALETRPHVTKKCVNGTQFKKTCSFSCEEGYKLTKTSSATIKCSCAAGGACTWNGNPASCERARCPALESRPHVTKKCVNGNQFRMVCSFSCEKGYKLTKTSSSTIKCSCAAGGACTWNRNPASCERDVKITERARCSGPRGKLPRRSSPTPVQPRASKDKTRYNYNELLHKSILFYEAQRSGPLSKGSRVPWRGDSGLRDGCDVKKDLTGGWYDAGDHVKFGFPMASSATLLAWGMAIFKEAYVDAGEWANALDMLKWATDYFVKAHTNEYELYGQVGGGKGDHLIWSRPEEMRMSRPSFKINARNPGSDLAGETAAALASSSIVFRESDPSYADLLLRHAKQLYKFAVRYRGVYHKSITDAEEFYSSYGYKDEIVWACLWLHKAAPKGQNIRECINKYNSFGLHYVATEFSWSLKTSGIQVLLANITGQGRYRSIVERFVRYCISGVPRTPGGLAYFTKWGSNGRAANAAFIALAASRMTNTRQSAQFRAYAQQQIYCMLGDGDNRRSYVVGFGRNPPSHQHHRSSSCPRWNGPRSRRCDWRDFSKSTSNPHVLYGALVGGPYLNGTYVDKRSDFVGNEVACDYNAGFQSAVAGLKYYVIKRRQ